MSLVLLGAFLNLRFVLAVLPLLVVFIGIVELRQSGATMAVVALALSGALAIVSFDTNPLVAVGAAAYGILRSFGITISVIATMLMIFIMREVGALERISAAIKGVAVTREQQTLFIGVGFGAFVTSLGVVTPSLLPPLLVAMGFSPFAAVAVSVLGYNAVTSYALLAIPITLPADIFGLNPRDFAFKINIFLPIVAILISIVMLWLLGGTASLKRGFVSAVLSGLSLSLACLLFGIVGTPVRVIGVLAGLFCMFVLYIYQRLFGRGPEMVKPVDRVSTVRALSPWLILIVLALVVSIPAATTFLRGLDGAVLSILGNPVDFDGFAQVYTWITVSILLSLPILKPSRMQLANAFMIWIRRIWQPVIAYSLLFGVAYVMAWSAMDFSNGQLVPNSNFADLNMDNVVGLALAELGPAFVFAAPWLGLFGAVVGGSEASSNVLFFPIQHKAAQAIGLTGTGENSSAFMTVYGAHANGGGIASAVTPSKINNAAVTIGAGAKLESEIMRSHVPFVTLITFAVGLLTAFFVAFSI